MRKGTWKLIPFVAALALTVGGLGTGYAQTIAGGSLDPLLVPKYQAQLVKPPVMPAAVVPDQPGKGKKKKITKMGGKNIEYYEIAVRQFQQQVLPAFQIDGTTAIPPTTVWSYGPANEFNAADNSGLHVTQGGHYFYPAFTIEAKASKPLRVKWINELKDQAGEGMGNYLQHLLPVDPTLHWANPPAGSLPLLYGSGARDTRPIFGTTPGPYTGPVPIVTHLHGAHVADISDGYAEEWFLPAAQNIPAGFATTGTWYDFFKPLGETTYGQTWTPGSAVFQYSNDQRASTLWFHDHTLGMTRLNVYAGPAGFYLIRGGPDDVVRDSATNMPAVLPGPAPGTTVDPFGDYYEIPIVIQDRSFNADGSLFFPADRAFFDGYPTDFGIDPATAFIPSTPISPIWNPEFFGNMMVVNGQTWPYLNVEKRRYRFRLLNGCNSRFLILDFSQIPGVEVWQIGADGGFLEVPVNLTTANANANQVLLGLAERADIIVDFTNVAEGSYVLGNVGPDAPFGGFPTTPSDPNTTGQVMQFRVVPIKGTDPSTDPKQLVLPTITPVDAPTIRQVSLNEEMFMNMTFGGPSAALLGTMDMGSPVKKLWMNAITENPQLNTTETWEIYNFTADAHPIHLHLVQFQVVNRQGLVLDAATGAPVTPVVLDGPARGPETWETGFKDTVIAYPGEVTRIKALFDMTGLYVWHCHILDHEDNEMMRPYFVGDTATDGAAYQTYAEGQLKNLFGPDMPMPPMP